jgi:hypothetical protein
MNFRVVPAAMQWPHSEFDGGASFNAFSSLPALQFAMCLAIISCKYL